MFFFNDPATTEIYTLSLHDALPIEWSAPAGRRRPGSRTPGRAGPTRGGRAPIARRPRRSRRARTPHRGCSGSSAAPGRRSEEHTSELQSRQYLVCRLLLEKKINTMLKLRLVPSVHQENHAGWSDASVQDQADENTTLVVWLEFAGIAECIQE